VERAYRTTRVTLVASYIGYYTALSRRIEGFDFPCDRMKNEDLFERLQKEFPDHEFAIVPMVHKPEDTGSFGITIDGHRPRITFSDTENVAVPMVPPMKLGADEMLADMLMAEVYKVIEVQKNDKK
jgi:hypothetical protein